MKQNFKVTLMDRITILAKKGVDTKDIRDYTVFVNEINIYIFIF